MNNYSLGILFLLTGFVRKAVAKLLHIAHLFFIKIQYCRQIASFDNPYRIKNKKPIKKGALDFVIKRWRLRLNRPFFLASSLIGIEITPHSAHAVEIINGRLAQFCYYFFLRKESVDAAIISKHIVVPCLKQMLDKGQLLGKKVVFSLPDSSVLQKTVLAPRHCTEEKLQVLILLEASDYFGVPPTDIYVDFQIIGCSLTAPEMLEVSFIACEAFQIKWLLQIAQQTGLNLVAVEPKSHAIKRARGVTFTIGDDVPLSVNFLTAIGLAKKQSHLINIPWLSYFFKWQST